MELVPSDFHSDVWRRMRAEMLTRLSEQRVLLESPSLDHDKTQTVRGRISALKELLALEHQPRQQEPGRFDAALVNDS